MRLIGQRDRVGGGESAHARSGSHRRASPAGCGPRRRGRSAASGLRPSSGREAAIRSPSRSCALPSIPVASSSRPRTSSPPAVTTAVASCPARAQLQFATEPASVEAAAAFCLEPEESHGHLSRNSGSTPICQPTSCKPLGCLPLHIRPDASVGARSYCASFPWTGNTGARTALVANGRPATAVHDRHFNAPAKPG